MLWTIAFHCRILPFSKHLQCILFSLDFYFSPQLSWVPTLGICKLFINFFIFLNEFKTCISKCLKKLNIELYIVAKTTLQSPFHFQAYSPSIKVFVEKKVTLRVGNSSLQNTDDSGKEGALVKSQMSFRTYKRAITRRRTAVVAHSHI